MSQVRLKQHILVILAYLVLTLVLTFPLIFSFNTRVVGYPWADWGQNIWGFWWLKTSLLRLGRSPFYTDFMFYPEGISLSLHTLEMTASLIVMPIYMLVGPIAAYNSAFILSFTLSAYAAYLLGLRLIKERRGAFFAGLVFAFAPYQFSHFSQGHLNLVHALWIPLYILFFLRWVSYGRWLDALLSVFSLVFTLTGGWYYRVYCGLFSLGVIAYPSLLPAPVAQAQVKDGVPRVVAVKRFAVVMALAGLILSPLLIDMIRISSTHPMPWRNPLGHSADLLTFLLPSSDQTWQPLLQDVWSHFGTYPGNRISRESRYYLGYSACFLAIYAVYSYRRRRVIFWAIVTLVAMLLAMGPYLTVNGERLPIPLPYQLLGLIPFFDLSGTPGRFDVMVILALGILAGYGISKLLQGRGNVLYVALSGLLLLEYLFIPLPTADTTVPPFYKTLGQMNEDFTIVDTGLRAHNFWLYHQSVHGKRLIGGWISRKPKDYKDRWGDELKRLIFQEMPPPGVTDNPKKQRQWLLSRLAHFRIRYIIDYQGSPDAELAQWNFPIIYDDGEIRVYEVR
jgi:hypothetical protein